MSRMRYGQYFVQLGSVHDAWHTITNAVTLCSGPTVGAAYIFLADIYVPLCGPMRLRLHVKLARLCFTNTEGSEACPR